MALTKAEIIESICKQLGFSKTQSTDVIEILLEILKRSMQSGNEVMISGFGKFCVKEKKERKGRNPSTGSDMMLPKRKVITFKCSRTLKDRINNHEI